MNIHIDKQLKTPVYLQLATGLKGEILAGRLAPGSVLPSVRAMAQRLGIHRNTVDKAYQVLKDQELIEGRQGVGCLVLRPMAEPEGAPGNQRQGETKKTVKKVNWVSLIRDEYMDMETTFDDLFQRSGDGKTISMGSGLSSPGIYDSKKIAETLTEAISEEGRVQYFYSPYKGDAFLRKKLVSFLSTKGIRATTGQIQILTETNQALDFLVMLLLKPGDTVVMEEPVSPDVYRAMELAGGRIVTVPVDEDGMQCEALERLILQHRPRLIYVNSSFHDPTGGILSLGRRRRLVDLSEKYRIPIIEEDAASELVYDGEKLPPLKALDMSGNIIYIYSFSLTFVPGLSLAFVVADQEVIRSLSYLVSVRMVNTDWIAQKLVAQYLDDGSYYDHLLDFRENYRRKAALACRELDALQDLGVSYRKPKGGVYIWCRLPAGVDSKELVDLAYSKGLTLLPGYVFYPFKNGGRDHIRINISYETEERIGRGMAILRETLEELRKK